MTAAAATPGAPAAVPAASGDLARLAALHRACLPGSILAALGEAAVMRYYAFALASPEERVLVVRDGAGADAGAVVAGCVLSLAPHTLLGRFARRAPAALARELARGLAADGALRRRMAARAAEAVRGLAAVAAVAARRPATVRAVAPLPEVTQIFTDPAERGRGLGATLLGAAEAALRGAGHRAYCIHTLRDDNDAGIRFYRREGFSATGTTRSFGDDYLLMTKELT